MRGEASLPRGGRRTGADVLHLLEGHRARRDLRHRAGPDAVEQLLDVLVLGGWGTGAYRLPWDLIMALFRDVIVETNALHRYRTIHFPLFADEGSGVGQEFEGIWAAADIPAQRALRECEHKS